MMSGVICLHVGKHFGIQMIDQHQKDYKYANSREDIFQKIEEQNQRNIAAEQNKQMNQC